MDTINLGRILALLGLILVLLTGWGRRRARQQQQAVSPALLKLQSWGSLAAFGLILAGLILMNYSAK
jgi:hypothetical protein